MKPGIGDWVRFYRNGQLVIGVVQYVTKDNLGYENLDTDAGMVRADSVREIRRAVTDGNQAATQSSGGSRGSEAP